MSSAWGLRRGRALGSPLLRQARAIDYTQPPVDSGSGRLARGICRLVLLRRDSPCSWQHWHDDRERSSRCDGSPDRLVRQYAVGGSRSFLQGWRPAPGKGGRTEVGVSAEGPGGLERRDVSASRARGPPPGTARHGGWCAPPPAASRSPPHGLRLGIQGLSKLLLPTRRPQSRPGWPGVAGARRSEQGPPPVEGSTSRPGSPSCGTLCPGASTASGQADRLSGEPSSLGRVAVALGA